MTLCHKMAEHSKLAVSLVEEAQVKVHLVSEEAAALAQNSAEIVQDFEALRQCVQELEDSQEVPLNAWFQHMISALARVMEQNQSLKEASEVSERRCCCCNAEGGDKAVQQADVHSLRVPPPSPLLRAIRSRKELEAERTADRVRLAEVEQYHESLKHDVAMAHERTTEAEQRGAEALRRCQAEKDTLSKERREAEDRTKALQERLDAATSQSRALHAEAQRAQLELVTEQRKFAAKIADLDERLVQTRAELADAKSDHFHVCRDRDECTSKNQHLEAQQCVPGCRWVA